MDTNELIKLLAADAGHRTAPLSSVWRGAGGLAVALAAVAFFALLGPRPDIATAVETPRFLFKFVVTIILAVSAFGLARALSRPGEAWRKSLPYLATGPALLAVAVVFELLLLPPDLWPAKLIGTNNLTCLTFILLIGIGPLAIILQVLHYCAPTRPIIAGAVAGVLAGGIAATFYAAQCTDDSPLFVATWYAIAVVGLAVVGVVAADRFALVASWL
jgi:hypothetical protein